jgi:hypothetical protein
VNIAVPAPHERPNKAKAGKSRVRSWDQYDSGRFFRISRVYSIWKE